MPKHPPSRLAPCIWPDVLVLASAPFTPTAPINPHSSSLLIRRGLVHRAVSPPRRLNYLLSQHLPASLTKPIAVQRFSELLSLCPQRFKASLILTEPNGR